MKVKLSLKKPYGDLTIEGNSFEELTESLKSIPQWLDVIDSLLLKAGAPPTKKESLKGVIEYTSDGTVITVPKERLSDKEAILLIIYANEPGLLQPKEIARLMTLSGRLSVGFGARLSELRNEGLVVKDAGSYRLTAVGKSSVENLLINLRSEG